MNNAKHLHSGSTDKQPQTHELDRITIQNMTSFVDPPPSASETVSHILPLLPENRKCACERCRQPVLRGEKGRGADVMKVGCSREKTADVRVV